MNEKQRLFCREYLKDLNGTQALIRAGYSAKTANVQAAKMLAKPSIKEYLELLREDLQKKEKVTPEWVIQNLKKLHRQCTGQEKINLTIVDANTRKRFDTTKYKFDATNANRSLENISKIFGFFELTKEQEEQVKDVRSLKEEIKELMKKNGIKSSP